MGSENTAIKMMTYISTSWIFSKTNYQYMYWYLIIGKTTPILVKTFSFEELNSYTSICIYAYVCLLSIYWNKVTVHYSNSVFEYSYFNISWIFISKPKIKGGGYTIPFKVYIFFNSLPFQMVTIKMKKNVNHNIYIWQNSICSNKTL